LIELTAVMPRSGDGEQDSVRVDSEQLVESRYASYLSDESGLGPGRAQIVFFPATERQIVDFLREMNTRKIPVTISGARTGIVGGAVPEGGALLSLDKMNRIVGILWDEKSSEWRITVEPGIRLKELHERIERKDLQGAHVVSSDPSWRDLPRFLSDPNQYFYAPDPTEDSASLGGTVATDASGARTYHFGRTRRYVRMLRIVLATGDVLEIHRGEQIFDSIRLFRLRLLDGSDKTVQIPSYESPQVKSSAGYLSTENMDLIDLFIGAEGTLGVVTLIEVALAVKPKHTAMFLAFFPSEDDAVGFAIRTRSLQTSNAKLTVHSIEYFDSNCLSLLRRMKLEGKLKTGITLPTAESSAAILCEFSYHDLPAAVQSLQPPLEEFGSSLNNSISAVEEQGMEQLRELRHAVPEAVNKIVAERKMRIAGMHKIGTDTSVPDEKLVTMLKSYTEMLRAANLEHYVLGHIAENHLHVNMLPKNQKELVEAERLAVEMAREAVALGGTVSAEHGIGKMKTRLLQIMFSDSEINQMLSTKRALDPNLILNLGNMIRF
jgi:D-lactate dehydrogenase (cytochrome)